MSSFSPVAGASSSQASFTVGDQQYLPAQTRYFRTSQTYSSRSAAAASNFNRTQRRTQAPLFRQTSSFIPRSQDQFGSDSNQSCRRSPPPRSSRREQIAEGVKNQRGQEAREPRMSRRSSIGSVSANVSKIVSYDETEDLIQLSCNLVAPQDDLIDLSESVGDLVDLDEPKGTKERALAIVKIAPAPKKDDVLVEVDPVPKQKLPRLAIAFDYTLQPVGLSDIKRIYLSQLHAPSTPFLRPIVLDGIGLVKAYKNCCGNELTEFPLVPILRCLFYWIARGHSTVLCFPLQFSPMTSERFNANNEQVKVIQLLARYKLIRFFNSNDEEGNKSWFAHLLEKRGACLITTVTQWRMQMPNDLESGVFTKLDGERHLLPSYVPHYVEQSPERLLQPFFSHNGRLVFFSSFSSSGHCVAETILFEQFGVKIESAEDFRRWNQRQLSFLNQCKQLKMLYDQLMPVESRFRETAVMIRILERLKGFL